MSTGFTLGLEYVLLLSAEETVVDSFRLLYIYLYIYIVYIYIFIGEWNRTTGGGKLVFFLFLSFRYELYLSLIFLFSKGWCRGWRVVEDRIAIRGITYASSQVRRPERKIVRAPGRSFDVAGIRLRLHRRHVQCECTRCWGRKRIPRLWKVSAASELVKFNGSSYEDKFTFVSCFDNLFPVIIKLIVKWSSNRDHCTKSWIDLETNRTLFKYLNE